MGIMTPIRLDVSLKMTKTHEIGWCERQEIENESLGDCYIVTSLFDIMERDDKKGDKTFKLLQARP